MDHEDQNDEYVSKSQRKRDSHARQDLGEQLVKLSLDQLSKFNLPEELHDAILQAQHTRQRGALKRQLQFIGRLMRELDPAPIQRQLDDVKGVSRQAVAQQHKIEQWRERLVSEGDSALQELVNLYPGIDRQRIRQLVRNVIKENESNKPPRAYRELFQLLRGIVEASNVNS